uniref:Lipoxygenase domain-containing protein n=1 Tax=Sphenodon punctatus TaxID=8508 RepID=A0A8D0HJ39_SPHPU
PTTGHRTQESWLPVPIPLSHETPRSCLSPEYVTNHWQEDSFFGYQYLNGVHPVFIRKCTEIPANFPVTQEMVAGSLGTSTTLQEALKTGKIFIADYKILEGLQTNVINSQTQHVTASLCLFYQEPSQGDLLPIAIQLTQTPGPESPIFLPSDSEWDWMLAKMWVRNSDFHVHQVVSHLLYTHLLAEVFAMATLRQLPMCHPLYKVRGVIWVEGVTSRMHTIHLTLALDLSDLPGFLLLGTGVGYSGLHPLMERGMQSLTYTTLCLPSDIQARGVNSIPNYCYRDDGMKLWTAIESFVSGIVEYYYKNNDRVQNDTELQAWVAEIFAEAFLGRNSSGAPSSIQTTAELVRFLTMVIFTCSAQHAAVNSAQFDFGAWMPNTPSSMRKPPPTAKGTATLESILETLPEVNTTCNIMIVLWQLSAEPEDKRPLGSFLDSHFVEVAPKRLIKAFQERLAEISMEIKERNKTLRLVYTYMDPPVVENSISI